MATIVTNPNYIQVDGARIQKGTRDIIPFENGVRLQNTGSGSVIDILVDGTTIDGQAVADRDELLEYLDSQGFKAGGSSPETEVSWGIITGNIEDQADLVNYIAENGGSVELGQGLHFDENGKVVLGTVDSDESSLITIPFKLTSKTLFEGIGEAEASFHILTDPNSSLPVFLTILQAISEVAVINAYNQLRLGSSLTHIGDTSDPSKYVSLEVATQPSLGSVTGVIITDTAFEKGAIYANDYSANFTDRSLVDKGYVDNKISEIGGDSVTWATIEGKPDFVAEGANAAAARTALGLGTAATTDSSAYATAAQGALASSSVQPATLDARLSAAQRSAIDALVSPETDYADMAEATAAIKSIIDALKA